MIYVETTSRSIRSSVLNPVRFLLALNQTFTVCREVVLRIHETFIGSAASKIKGSSRIVPHVTIVNSPQLKYLRIRRA